MRKIIGLSILIIPITLLAACSSDNRNGQARDQRSEIPPPGNVQSTPTGEVNVAGGLEWDIPPDWKVGPVQQMRIATYVVPAVESDSEHADCAVFHFPGTGGDIESNLRRWEGQFEQPDGRNSSELASISETEVNGLPVTTIELSGTYRVTGGPMMEVQGKKPGFRLMGAIIEGPQGPVFFKMVGPEKTVTNAHDKFMDMIKSARTDS